MRMHTRPLDITAIIARADVLIARLLWKDTINGLVFVLSLCYDYDPHAFGRFAWERNYYETLS